MPAYSEYRLKELAHRKVRRRKMTTIILPDRKAKGSARNFHKAMRADRQPIVTSGTINLEKAALLAAGRR